MVSRHALSTRPAGPLYRRHIGTAKDATVRDLSITICLASRGTIWWSTPTCLTRAVPPQLQVYEPSAGETFLPPLARILEPSLGDSSCEKDLGPREDRLHLPESNSAKVHRHAASSQANICRADETHVFGRAVRCDTSAGDDEIPPNPQIQRRRTKMRDQGRANPKHACQILPAERGRSRVRPYREKQWPPTRQPDGPECRMRGERVDGQRHAQLSKKALWGNRSVAPAPGREQKPYWRPVTCPTAVENRRPAVYFGPLPLRNSPQHREKLPP